jgi:hypothetical protein
METCWEKITWEIKELEKKITFYRQKISSPKFDTT